MKVWILQEGSVDESGVSILSVATSEGRGLELAGRWIDKNGGLSKWTTVTTPFIYAMCWEHKDTGQTLHLQDQPVIE